MKIAFDKLPKKYSQFIEILKNRGLKFLDEEKSFKYLKHINYYRLSGYFIPFQEEEHQFRENIYFEDIINLYEFDRKLKLLTLNAIERIEVSVKSVYSYELSLKHNPHFFLDSKFFH